MWVLLRSSILFVALASNHCMCVCECARRGSVGENLSEYATIYKQFYLDIKQWNIECKMMTTTTIGEKQCYVLFRHLYYIFFVSFAF